MGRIIRVIGIIDADSFLQFSMELTELEKSSKPIEIELNSEGGVDFDALAFVSRIRRSRCPINITGLGFIASAATLILVAGAHRRLCKDAWVMVHESRDKIRGTASQLSAAVKQLQRAEDHWCKLMAMYTALSATEWRDINARGDTYLDATECLEYGMIDEIV